MFLFLYYCMTFARIAVFTDGFSHAVLPPRGNKINGKQAQVSKRFLTRRFQYSSLFDDEWQKFQRTQTNLELINCLVQPRDSLQEVFLVGKASLMMVNSSETVPCLVLSSNHPNSFDPRLSERQQSSCLMIPVTNSELKLLSYAVQDRPLSKSVMLSLNQILVNRDGTLFDNIPWASWTVDPQLRNRDVSGNSIDPKYHMGKRDAFARFGGKDWKGRSVSIGNLALRLKYSLQQPASTPSDENVLLTKRILELQIKEITEETAEVEYQLAVARMNKEQDIPSLLQKQIDCLTNLQTAQKSLLYIQNRNRLSSSVLDSILDSIVDSTTNNQDNVAPYRGATGYAPTLDTEQDIDSGLLPFSSPFSLMLEILESQCKAQVIGALLENASPVDGTLVIGGAIIIQRVTASTVVKISGEEVLVYDETNDFGNTGVTAGETFLVECSADEAIGMALASKAPLQVESELWDQASILASSLSYEKSENVLDTLRRWIPDRSIEVLLEGQASDQSRPQQQLPLRIARTTASLFDSLFAPSSPDSRPSLFPSENPIRSLREYDVLSDSDKARTLLGMSNFNGILPRPRALRVANTNFSSRAGPGPLDALLLPLLDESVRRQFLIRDAERRKDFDTVRELEAKKSRRQVAMELAEEAEDSGDEDMASAWKGEAEFYSSLRADVSQDEGSYSRFMDQDEWYARDAKARIEKIDRKKFGNLLDGID